MSVSAALRARVDAHIDQLLRLASRDDESPPRPQRRPRPSDDEDENDIYEDRDVRPRTEYDQDVGPATGRSLEEEEVEDFAVELQDLPDEILGEILAHRPIPDLMILREVSPRFRRIIETFVFLSKKTIILTDVISEKGLRVYRSAMPYFRNLERVRLLQSTRRPHRVLERYFGGGYVGRKVKTLEIIRFCVPDGPVSPLSEKKLVQWFPQLTVFRGHEPLSISYHRLTQTPLRTIDLFPQDWPLTRTILEAMPLSNKGLNGPRPYNTIREALQLSMLNVRGAPPTFKMRPSSFPFQVRATNMQFAPLRYPNYTEKTESHSLCILDSRNNGGVANLSRLPRDLRELTIIWTDRGGHPTFEGALPPDLVTLQYFSLSLTSTTNDFLKPLIREIGASLKHLAMTLETHDGPQFDWFLNHVSLHATNLERLGIYAAGHVPSLVWNWNVSNVQPMNKLEILELITPQLPIMRDRSIANEEEEEDESSLQPKTIFPNVRAFRSSATNQGVPAFLPRVTRYEPIRPLSVSFSVRQIEYGAANPSELLRYPIMHSDQLPYRLWGLSQPFSETWFRQGPARAMILPYIWNTRVETEPLPTSTERRLLLQLAADFAHVILETPRFSSQMPESNILFQNALSLARGLRLRIFRYNPEAEKAFAENPITAEIPYQRSLREDAGVVVINATAQPRPQDPSIVPQTLKEWRIFKQIQNAGHPNGFAIIVANDYFRWLRNTELRWSIDVRNPLLVQLGEDVPQFIASFGGGSVSVNLRNVVVPQDTLDEEMALITFHKRLNVLSIVGKGDDPKFTFFPAHTPLPYFRVGDLQYHVETLHQFAVEDELGWSIDNFSVMDSRLEGFNKRRAPPVTFVPFPEFKRLGQCTNLEVALLDTTIAQCENFAAQNVKIFYEARVEKFTFTSRNRANNKPVLSLSIPSTCKTASLKYLRLSGDVFQGDHPNLSSLILKRCQLDGGIRLPKKDYPELAKLSFDSA